MYCYHLSRILPCQGRASVCPNMPIMASLRVSLAIGLKYSILSQHIFTVTSLWSDWPGHDHLSILIKSRIIGADVRWPGAGPDSGDGSGHMRHQAQSPGDHDIHEFSITSSGSGIFRKLKRKHLDAFLRVLHDSLLIFVRLFAVQPILQHCSLSAGCCSGNGCWLGGNCLPSQWEQLSPGRAMSRCQKIN